MLDERIIAYAITNKSLAIKVVDKVMPKTLKPEFRPMLLVIAECVKKYNEVPTIEMMKRCEKWDDDLKNIFETAKDIKNDDDFVPENFIIELEDLKERYKKTTILKVGKEIFKENWNGKDFNDLQEAAKSLKKVVGELDQLEVGRTYKEGTVAETSDSAKEEYIKRKENPEIAKGLLTGYRELDRITNGLQKSELILIGGTSGSGKSTLSMNMAMNCWLGSNSVPPPGSPVPEFSTDGANVVYFTLEMPFDPFRRRFDACLAEVPLYGIRDGTLTNSEEEKYFNALSFQKIYPKQFYVVDIPRGCTVAQIEAKYLELLYDFVPEIVVIDYISLLKADNNLEQDWLNLGRLAEYLHDFCRNFSIPLISPVQLTRNKPGDRAPGQERVGRSILLPQNCNIMLNIETREDESTRLDMPIHIVKMRDGEQGGCFMLQKRFDLMRIYDEDLDSWSPEFEGQNAE